MANKDEVKIPISLPGAAGAATDAGKVADGLKKIDGAARQAGKGAEQQAAGAKTAGKEIASLGEVSEKGIGIGRMLGEVMRGNYGALLNITAALKATGAAFKTNFLGIAVLALTAVAAALPPLIEKLRGTKKATDDLGGSAGEAARHFGSMAGSEAQFDRLQKKLAEVRKEIDSVSSGLRELRNAADAVEDAEMAVELAKLDRAEAEELASPYLSEDQRQNVKDNFEMQRSGLRQGAAERRATSRLTRTIADIAGNQQAQAQNVDERAQLATEEVTARRQVQARVAEANRLRRFIDSTGSTQALPGVPETAEDTARRGLAEKAKAELEGVLKSVAEAEKLLEKIQQQRATADERGKALGREGGVLFRRAEGDSLNVEAVRQRGIADAQAASNARQAANRAAIEASNPGSTAQPMFGPVPGRPAPGREGIAISGRDEPRDREALAKIMSQEGQKTGAELAAEMAEAVRRNNAELVRKFREDIRNLTPRQ
jgi:hypothetical protein